MGMLAIELASRKRIRLNGRAEFDENEHIWFRTSEVWANCPKYIQSREIKTRATPEKPVSSSRHHALTPEQTKWIEQADTFFIATYFAQKGADASHRGGMPGFVKVLNQNKLVFPDYSGNQMFQTLGNLAVNPNAGLVFIDFETGSTLQLSGKTEIGWGEADTARFNGAERVIYFEIGEIGEIDQIIETRNALPLRGQLLNYSHFNPS
jgi:uncharacterized protein